MWPRLFLAGLMALSLIGTTNAGTKHPKRLRAVASGMVSSAQKNPCADPYAVCWAGNYIGRDPDPRVRSRLLWDFQSGLSND